MHKIVISFSFNYTTTKIVFVNALHCQMKGYSKIQNLHFAACNKQLSGMKNEMEINKPPKN